MLRLLPLILLLGACSRTDNEPGPGGVTVGEAKALDDAAAMLEERDRTEEAANNSETASGETDATGGKDPTQN